MNSLIGRPQVSSLKVALDQINFYVTNALAYEAVRKRTFLKLILEFASHLLLPEFR